MNIEPMPKEVRALDNYLVYLKFKTGEERIFDMKELINNNKLYRKLKNKEYFKNVKVSDCTIEWEDGEDVAPEYLYNDSIPIEEYID